MGHTVPPLAPIHSSVNWWTYGSRGHGPAATWTRRYVHQWRVTDERNPLYPSVPHHRRTYLIFVGTDDWRIYDLGHIFVGLIYRFVGLNQQIFHTFLYWWLILHLENKKSVVICQSWRRDTPCNCTWLGLHLSSPIRVVYLDPLIWFSY
jgi:hypothetical protein